MMWGGAEQLTLGNLRYEMPLHNKLSAEDCSLTGKNVMLLDNLSFLSFIFPILAISIISVYL